MAHSHGHDHSHAASSRKRLIGALAVTALVFVGELIAAYISGSLSLAATPDTWRWTALAWSLLCWRPT